MEGCNVLPNDLKDLFRSQTDTAGGGFSSGHRWGILGGHPGIRYRAVCTTKKSDIGLYFDLFLNDFETITDT
jgi:hypothetical protein